MKALSIWQPWASAIALGHKRVETRSWSTPYRGPLLIHAARTPASGLQVIREMPELWREVLPVADGQTLEQVFRALPFGAIVAQVDLVGVVRADHRDELRQAAVRAGGKYSHLEPDLGDYSQGRFAWFFANVRAFPEPLAIKAGQLGLFDVELPNDKPAAAQP
ncbi:MAG: hypothetical protein RJA36_780 [Pseudomonadota bacterium]|jgi:hypothetical protein